MTTPIQAQPSALSIQSPLDIQLLRARAQADELSVEELGEIIRRLRADRFSALSTSASSVSRSKASSKKASVDPAALLSSILGAQK